MKPFFKKNLDLKKTPLSSSFDERVTTHWVIEVVFRETHACLCQLGKCFFGVTPAIVSLEPIMTALFYKLCLPPHIPFSVCHQLIQLSPSIPSRGYSPDYSACVCALRASVRRPAVFLGQFLPAEHLGMSYPNWGGWTTPPSTRKIEEKLIFRSGWRYRKRSGWEPAELPPWVHLVLAPSLIHATPQSRKIKDRVGPFFFFLPSPMSATSRRVLLCSQRVTGASWVILPAFQWAGEVNKRSLQVERWLLFSCCCSFLFPSTAAAGLIAARLAKRELLFTQQAVCSPSWSFCPLRRFFGLSLASQPVALQACSSFKDSALNKGGRGGESSLTNGNVVLTVKSCCLRNFCKNS